MPAREGARRAISAAIKAGVKRVVLDLLGGGDHARVGGARVSGSDETVLDRPLRPRVGAYARSKTLAERAAWDLIGALGRRHDTRPPSTLPGARRRCSAATSPHWSRSCQRLLTGRVPGLPRLGLQHRRRARRGRPAHRAP